MLFLLFIFHYSFKTCVHETGNNETISIQVRGPKSVIIGEKLIKLGYKITYGTNNNHDFLIIPYYKCPLHYKESDIFNDFINIPNSIFKTYVYIRILMISIALILILLLSSFFEIPMYRSTNFRIKMKVNFIPRPQPPQGAFGTEREGSLINILHRVTINITRLVSFILYYDRQEALSDQDVFVGLPSSSFETEELPDDRLFAPQMVDEDGRTAISFNIDNMSIVTYPKDEMYLGHSGICNLFKLCVDGFRRYMKIYDAKDFHELCYTLKTLIDLNAIVIGSSLNGRIRIIEQLKDESVPDEVLGEFAGILNDEANQDMDIVAKTIGNYRIWGSLIILGKTRYFLYLVRTNKCAVVRSVEYIATQITVLACCVILSLLQHFSIIDIMNTYDIYMKYNADHQPDILFRLIKSSVLIPFSSDFKLQQNENPSIVKIITPILQMQKNCIITLSKSKQQILVVHTPSSDIVSGFISFLKQQKIDLASITLENSNFMGWLIRVEDLRVVWIMSSKMTTFNDILQLFDENDRNSFMAAAEHTRKYRQIDMSLKAKIKIFNSYKLCRVSLIRSSDEYFVVIVNDEEDYIKSILELKGIERTVSMALTAGNVTLWNYEDTNNPPRILMSWKDTEPNCMTNRTTILSNVLIEYQKEAFDNFEQCMRTGTPFMIDIPVLIGSLKWFSIRGIRSSSNSLQLLNIDITQTKEAEERLIEEKRRVEEAANAKTRFLANMSHEIRNPLNGISGLLELLTDTKLPPGNEDNIEILTSSFGKLLDLLNDTLDLAKIEQNKMKPSFAIFNPVEEFEKIIQKYRKQPIPIFTSSDPNFPILMRGEPHFLARISSNLISNAVKFTHKGNVRVQLKSDNDKTFTLIIEDTGIGISAEDQKKIFNIFIMGDSSIRRPYGGIGVGLCLCQKMLDLINGKMTLESVEGKGTKFIVTFPFETIYVPYVPKTIRDKNFYILNLTKSPILNTILSPYCAFYGFKLISDINLLKGTLAIILLSNNQNQIDEALQYKSKYPKCKLFLSYTKGEKPIYDGPEMKSYEIPIPLPVTHSLFSETAWRRRVSCGDDCFAPLNVLLAEDNSTNQLVMRKIFQKLGANATIVDNGREAVEKLRKNNYDIVFLDEFMPEMDGHSAAIEIRKFNENVTLVALTASHSKDDEELCLSAGMNDFITKPVSINNIKSILLKYSHRH